MAATVANATEKLQLGERGIHVSVKNGQMDIRLFQRDFTLADSLHPTWKGIEISQEEWIALVHIAPEINACVVAHIQDGQEPSLFKMIGQRGVHVQANVFNNQLLVQIRMYSRAFHDPNKLFPTKKGVALKPDEWAVLYNNMKDLSAQLIAG